MDHGNDANTNIQTELVNKWFKEKYSGCSKPVFFCGDMNMEPGSPTMHSSTFTLFSPFKIFFPGAALGG